MQSSRLPRCVLAAIPVIISVTCSADEPPQFTIPSSHYERTTPPIALYPTQAQRLQQQGRVLIQFDISANGRPTGVKVLLSEPGRVFEKSATALISSRRFDVPENWAGSAASKHHFTQSIAYYFKPCPPPSTCAVIDDYPADEHMAITSDILGPHPYFAVPPK